MYAQHKKEIPPTIPKHPFDDHKIYTVRKNIILSFTFLLTVTEKKPSPTATIIFLSLSFATVNLYFLPPKIILTRASTGKSKFPAHPRYTVIIQTF